MWATPQDFFDNLDAEFNFDIDVCATPENAKCERFFTEEQDGLSKSWGGVLAGATLLTDGKSGNGYQKHIRLVKTKVLQ